ncbi:MAG: LytR C-terminal domain-containing protein [Actinomycetota bacterium]|nr:LytR C-terminal domain-containing protein [Actinomycetota bacterium]
MPASYRSSRRPRHSGSSRNRRVYAGGSSTPSTRASRSRSVPTSAARMRAQREQEVVSRKTERSGKAAGKGAILILAISLIAIKAFSSLPSTVKTSSDKSLGITKALHPTTTTFAKSVSSAPSSNSGVTGGSVSPDQVVLPQISPSKGSSGANSGSASTSVKTTGTVSPGNPAAASSSVSNSQVTVRVFNGTNVAGAAGKVTNQLAQLGYNVVAAANANTQNITTTEIYYSPGYTSQADRLAVALGLGVSSVKPISFATPIPAVQPSDLNVVLGTDKAG